MSEHTEPPHGRLRGGFRSGEGLQSTERAHACVDSEVCCTGYDARDDRETVSWLLERDALEAITAVDVAPDGSVVLFVEAVSDDDAATGTTIRLDRDAAARVGEALLEASDA